MDTQPLPKILFFIDKIILLLTGISTIIISLGNFFGFFNYSFTNHPEIFYLFTGIFFTGITALLFAAITHIERLLEKKVVVQTTKLETIDDFYTSLAKELRSARVSIDDITWGCGTGCGTQSDREAYEKYIKTAEEICKNNKSVKYREISSLADEHFISRSENLINYFNYHLGYFNLSQFTIPLMTFIIIDSKKVITGSYKAAHADEGEVYSVITDPLVVSIFQGYYNTLWAQSEKIKDSKVPSERIERIKKQKGIIPKIS